MDEYQDQIEHAARLHYGFLPGTFANGTLNAAVRMEPFGTIGGDYCSLFPVGNERIVFGMCDVVGHSVSSALVAARVNTFVTSHAVRAAHPCDLVEPLNSFLCRNTSNESLYTSFFCLMLDLGRMEVSYAGAGHPPVIHYRAAAGDYRELESGTTPLGIMDPLPLHCHVETVPVSPGDRLLLYTDGLSEMRDGDGRHFGTEGIAALAREHAQLDAAGFCDLAVHGAVHSGRYSVTDDILVMAIHFNPAADGR